MKVTELDVWNAAMDLAEKSYRLVEKFPESDGMGLSFHFRKAVTHLPANISAAASRKYGRESLSYLFDAKGEIYEIESMTYLAERLNYISLDERDEHLEVLDTARKLLFGFIKYYKKAS
ncbi:MAG: four helix bundle protein [Bacteroidetes bacterium]|nr:four helix bundle protein [Bacteroidota bacterium]